MRNAFRASLNFKLGSQELINWGHGDAYSKIKQAEKFV